MAMPEFYFEFFFFFCFATHYLNMFSCKLPLWGLFKATFLEGVIFTFSYIFIFVIQAHLNVFPLKGKVAKPKG